MRKWSLRQPLPHSPSSVTAFVTDAEEKELVVADLGTGKVLARHALEHTPVEMVAVTGEAPHAHEH
ncbi:hypothetical protein LG324_18285 [Phycicoccus jejuensis]|uniref:hypothetical protein n=1 Tax=Phycicoccus jejuensis TaxID=367299 RepID=UPI00384C1FC0